MSVDCPLCNSQSDLVWSTTTDKEYFTLQGQTFCFRLCLACDIIFIDQNLEEQLPLIYPKDYYSFGKSKIRVLLKVKFFFDWLKFRKLVSCLHEPIRILDIGGGSGEVARSIIGVLKGKNTEVTIVDFDSDAEILAREIGFHYFRGTFETFRPNQKYDLIIALNVVEHVANPLSFISKTYECLSDDGIAIFQTPNFDSLDARLFRKRYWGGLHAPRHFVLFSSKSFVQILETNKFRILKNHRISGGTFWATSILGSYGKKIYKRPMIRSWLFYPLLIAFSIFDLIRGVFFDTSQQMIIAVK